jgi:hypothetical protein
MRRQALEMEAQKRAQQEEARKKEEAKKMAEEARRKAEEAVSAKRVFALHVRVCLPARCDRSMDSQPERMHG